MVLFLTSDYLLFCLEGRFQGMEVTADMLSGLTTGIFNTMEVVVPIGCTIMAAFLGVKSIPKIVGWFTRG